MNMIKKKFKVLVVDDEIEYQGVYQNLSSDFFEIEICDTCSKLSRLSESRVHYDLIVLDIQFNDQGVELIKMMLNSFSVNIDQLIVLSYEGAEAYRQAVQRLGVGVYLLKPISAEMLSFKIQSKLGSLRGAKPMTLVTGDITLNSVANKDDVKPLVLVVDDCQNERDRMHHILSGQYNVVAVSSGQKAIEKLKYGLQPIVILLDIVMDEGNGFETLIALQDVASVEPVSVVCVSAKNIVSFKKRAFQLGASEYLCKPYSTSAILNAVEKFVTKKKVNSVIKKVVGND